MKKRGIKGLNAFILTLAMIIQLFTPAAASAANVENEIRSAEHTVIIDNTEAEKVGTWTASTYRKGYYGSNYEIGKKDSTGGTYMIYRPEIKVSGRYKVYYIQPDGTTDYPENIASNAHYTIGHKEGTSEVRKSQRVAGEKWNLIGEYNFSKGTDGYVRLSTDVNAENTFADAIKFEYAGRFVQEVVVDNTEAEVTGSWTPSTYRSGYYGSDYCTAPLTAEGATVTYRPELPETGHYAVSCWEPEGDAVNVPYTISGLNGIQKILFNQKIAPSGRWNLLGVYPFAQGNSGSVTIINSGGADHAVADAMRFVLVDQSLDNSEFDKQGDWTEISADGAAQGSYEISASENARAETEVMPLVSGYYQMSYEFGSEEGMTSCVSVLISSQDEVGNEQTLTLRPEKKPEIIHLEAGRNYTFAVTNAEEGILYLDDITLRFTGYDLEYEEFGSSSDSGDWVLDGDWRIENQILTGSQGMAEFTAASWDNAWISFKFKQPAAGGEWGIVLSETEDTRTLLRHDAASKKMLLVDERTQETIAESDEVSFAYDAEHKVDAEYTYPYLRIYLDGNQIIEVESERKGNVGFYSDGAALEVYGVYASARSGIEVNKEGSYAVNLDEARQTIWGLGIEVQSDSIGSGNNGLPEDTTSVPHDLIESEREKLYSDMLSGFRYLRLAGGLYYRGTDEQGKHLKERWDTQNEELAELIEKSGIEGVDLEFWSPTPYFKSSGSYLVSNQKKTLKCFDSSFTGNKQTFLKDFAKTIVDDIHYLNSEGIPIIQFGLQNEPSYSPTTYSHCYYSGSNYYETMKAVVPLIKKDFPYMHVHADSLSGQYSEGSKKIIADAELLKDIDAWTFHRIGSDSNEQIDQADYYNSNKGNDNIPVYNNEFEYLDEKTNNTRCINTAQSLMNWMVFENSPTWHWLHMLKPLGNSEATGYSLGFWRSPGDTNEYSMNNHIEEGHWDYNYQNFNSIRGFLKYMPWDSVRYDVTEDQVRYDQRIMSYKTPDGRQIVAVTNRSTDYFKFNIDMGKDSVYRGYRYTPTDKDEIVLGVQSGSVINPVLAPLSIEFWVEEPQKEITPKLSLNKTHLRIEESTSDRLNAFVQDEGTEQEALLWQSSDSEIVSVDTQGTVTAKKAGRAVITVSTEKGDSAQCSVLVTSAQIVLNTEIPVRYLEQPFYLPGNVSITYGGETFNTDVAWNEEEAAAVQNASEAGKYFVTGTLAKPEGREIQVEVLTAPGNIVYFVDNGASAFTEKGQIVLDSNKDTIKNSAPDQAYDEESGWGFTNNAADLQTDGSGDAYKTVRHFKSGVNGKTLTYQFALEAGTYDVTAGFYDPWAEWAGDYRHAKVSLTDESGAELALKADYHIKDKGVLQFTDITLDEDGNISLNAAPLKSGNDNCDMVISFIVITRKTDVTEYTVSFDAAGGTGDAFQTVTKGSRLTRPSDPTRTGYLFTGWFRDEACTQAWAFDTDTVNQDMILYAGWTSLIAPKPITEIEITGQPETLTVGETYQLVASAVPKDTTDDRTLSYTSENSEIASVNEAGIVTANGEGTTRIVIASIIRPEVTTTVMITVAKKMVETDDRAKAALKAAISLAEKLKAENYTEQSFNVLTQAIADAKDAYQAEGLTADELQNKINCLTDAVAGLQPSDMLKYTVIFDEKGGSGGASQTVTRGSKLTKPSDPTRAGYRFTGWFLDEACTQEWVFDTDTVNGNMILYAGWASLIEPNPITEIKIMGESETLIAGETYQIVAGASPENTTDDKTLRYSSENAKIASVDDLGVVTAHKEGATRIIIASTARPEVTAAVTITVAKNVDETNDSAKAALKTAIDLAEKLKAGDYTEQSFEVLTQALADAKDAYQTDGLTVDELLEKIDGLAYAVSGLQSLEEEKNKELIKLLEQKKQELEKAEVQAKKQADLALAKAKEREKALLQSQEEARRIKSELEKLKNSLELKQGDTVVVNGTRYRVTNAQNKQVQAYGVQNKKIKKLTIAGTVRVKGVTCKVTEIADKAFSYLNNMTSAVIGKNVTSIGKRAFYGNKRLRSITLKGKKLKKVNKEALKGISKKAIIKVPESKKKIYTQILRGGGLKKTVKIR